MVGQFGQGQKKITKRGVGAAVLGALVLATLPAYSAPAYNFVVPRGVKKIRVRSYRNGKQVIDTELNVIPGQVFRIDSIQGE